MINNKLRWIIKKTLRIFSRIIPESQLSNLSQKPFNRIAYFIGGGIGDAIMSYPAINLIEKTWPKAELHIFVSPEKAQIISTLFKDYRVFSFKSLILFVLKYRILYSGFDISFTNTIAVFHVKIELASFFTCKRTFGFHYPDELNNDRLYSYSMKFSESKHFSEQNVSIVTQFNSSKIRIPKIEYCISYSKSERKHIIIHPGSEKGYENKHWPLENYKAIISKLLKNKYKVILLLGKADINLQNDFKNIKGIKIIIHPPSKYLIHLFRQAILFIGNDSGPSHIASFLKTPGITLFGPVSPVNSEPIGKTDTTIYTNLDCSPCHFLNIQCHDNLCMKSISVQRVWNEIERKLLKYEI